MRRLYGSVGTLLLVVLSASCDRASDPLMPAGAGLDVSRTSHTAFAKGGNGANQDSSEVAPEDLSPVATFTNAGNGAQIANAQIGPEGGSLRLGDFEIVVPAGAVDAKTHFQIRVLPESNGKKHAMASFLPHGTFNVPVTLRVPLNATESAGAADAHVLWWDGTAWEQLPSQITTDGRLETQVSHFSMYATQRRSGFTMAGG